MAEWYDHAIIYQIYPKSFQDSNGDGIGDLNGIQQRIPYLKQLGINAVWLNPVFVSPQVDNGYDVANYYAIDERMGTMADMEALIKAMHAAGIRVIMDFVLNHTSDQHPWFQDAVTTKNSIYRDYYIFAGENGQRPNNWGSFFGGSVWAADPSGSGQSYFHLFDKRMPDLNWANPEVRLAMGDVAEFWLAKGIDGLRLDAFIHIAKADLGQDYPTDDPTEPVVAEPFFANLPNVQRWLRPFCARIKQDYPGAFLLGEAASANVNLAVDYTSDHAKLMDSVITFRYFDRDESQVLPNLPANYQPAPLNWQHFRQTQAVWQQTLQGVAQPTLYWGNHDMARLATRIAQTPVQARSVAMLMYLERGIPIIYYGEELGMANLEFTDAAQFNDVTVDDFVRQAIQNGFTREQALQLVSQTHKLPARGPMLWDDSPQHGFSTSKPWLNGGGSTTPPVASQEQDEQSMLNFYRQLLAIKQQPVFQDGAFRLLTMGDASYVYLRQSAVETALVAVNLTAAPISLTLPAGDYTPLLHAGDFALADVKLDLAPYAGVAFQRY
ncbi:glycoside hydrolase family 13 protein [Lacticaseibacillus sharpeae]|uniref:Alpha-glucosidase n=1 Tax=Lacticaseibacillus sharpeae JCM 1186 = DSM 20505 TaxID=1291052 RepID=A0A0R1ZGR0_9LACO|nr:alpha-glucosidase [Lacticaseibacillus sharpeae]KRM54184.1 alpha-glucosidase [Lacticaseibacillus sharpeae JCM 1186 = DSM 20505]